MKRGIFLVKLFVFFLIFLLISYFSIYVYSFITPKMSLSSANQFIYYDNQGEIMLEDALGN